MITQSGPDAGSDDACTSCFSRRGLMVAALAAGGAAVTGGLSPAAAGQAQWRTVARKGRIRVGSAKVLNVAGEPLIVTRPATDVFKAFTAICTHAGCAVSGIRRRRIYCGCHGSEFSMRTGAAVGGPATRPLDGYRVRVRGRRVQVLV